MSGNGCGQDGGCACRHAVEREAQETHSTGSRLARRDALKAGAAALAAVLLDWLPPSSTSGALVQTLRKAFKPPKGAKKVGTIKHLAAGSALDVIDPKSGRPAVVVRLSEKKSLKAYSAVCTHRGCTVHFDPDQKLLACPCHGSQFDPAQNAAVVSGPALAALPSLKVKLDPKGNIWLV